MFIDRRLFVFETFFFGFYVLLHLGYGRDSLFL
jgi:hypothetical protein